MLRHHRWSHILEFLDMIAGRLGTSIYDNRCGKSWDVGQAVCAEAYGLEWMEHPTFQEWNQKDDSIAPEQHYYDCAARMADGYTPPWAEETEEGNHEPTL